MEKNQVQTEKSIINELIDEDSIDDGLIKIRIIDSEDSEDDFNMNELISFNSKPKENLNSLKECANENQKDNMDSSDEDFHLNVTDDESDSFLESGFAGFPCNEINDIKKQHPKIFGENDNIDDDISEAIRLKEEIKNEAMIGEETYSERRLSKSSSLELDNDVLLINPNKENTLSGFAGFHYNEINDSKNHSKVSSYDNIDDISDALRLKNEFQTEAILGKDIYSNRRSSTKAFSSEINNDMLLIKQENESPLNSQETTLVDFIDLTSVLNDHFYLSSKEVTDIINRKKSVIKKENESDHVYYETENNKNNLKLEQPIDENDEKDIQKIIGNVKAGENSHVENKSFLQNKSLAAIDEEVIEDSAMDVQNECEISESNINQNENINDLLKIIGNRLNSTSDHVEMNGFDLENSFNVINKLYELLLISKNKSNLEKNTNIDECLVKIENITKIFNKSILPCKVEQSTTISNIKQESNENEKVDQVEISCYEKIMEDENKEKTSQEEIETASSPHNDVIDMDITSSDNYQSNQIQENDNLSQICNKVFDSNEVTIKESVEENSKEIETKVNSNEFIANTSNKSSIVDYKLKEIEDFAKALLEKHNILKQTFQDKLLENEDELNQEISGTLLQLRNEFMVISNNYFIKKEKYIELGIQTDESALAKNLNEKYKKRHLASSSSDDGSAISENYSEDEYTYVRRRKKMKKLKKCMNKVLSNSSDDDENARVGNDNISSDIDNNSTATNIDNTTTRFSLESNDVDKSNENDLDSDKLQQEELFEAIKNIPEKQNEIDEKIDQNSLGSIESVQSHISENVSNENNKIPPEKIKETKDNLEKEEDLDLIRDKEIDRLINFTTLDLKRSTNENQRIETTTYKKNRKSTDLLEILKEVESKAHTDESSNESDNTISEEQYLLQKNQELKMKLLKSDTDASELESDYEFPETNYISSDSDISKESFNAIDKFLDSMSKKAVEDEINSIEKIGKPETVENEKNLVTEDNISVMENDVLENNLENGELDSENDGKNDNCSNEFDIALENFWKEDSCREDEILDQVIESGGIIADDVDKPILELKNSEEEKSEQLKELTNNSELKDNENVENSTQAKTTLCNENVLTLEEETENKNNDHNKSKSSDKSDDNETVKNYSLDSDDESSHSNTITKTLKMKNRDNLDKEIFSKNFFEDDNSSLEKSTVKSYNSNKSDDKLEKNSSNADSDCEILDVSMFNKKRKVPENTDIEKLLNAKYKPRPHASGNNSNSNNTSTSKKDDDCIELSSDSDLDLEEVIPQDEEENTVPGKKPRAILTEDQLTVETKQAQKEEADRAKRLDKKHEQMNQKISDKAIVLDTNEILLDYDSKRKMKISVHPDLVKQLKPHQIDGIKFMYDTCYGSVDFLEKYPGSGCILAHCMGLGKTLQLITLLHTLFRYPQTKTKKVLVICPKSTVMNWKEEIQRWLGPIKPVPSLKVFHFPDNCDINDKMKILTEWHKSGSIGYCKSGCLLVGYEAFRSLVFYHLSKKKQGISLMPQQMDEIKKKVDETLLNPGADLVICDEGHVIKNKKSATSVAVSKIRTKKRIILTGTPIQNNLKEYYCMVNFIKPSFLGTEKEFANLYANPIKNGQHKDSTKSEIKFMKQRSFVLHKKLSKFVQRREAAVLKSFLPEKFEYVLFIPMTKIQERLYEYFLENNPLKEKYGGKSLIPDYTFLRKIWTHPKVLENAWQNALMRKEKEKIKMRKLLQDSEDEMPDDVLDNQIGKMSVTNDWWRQHIEPEDLVSLLPSNKLRVLFEILKLCEENGEKCLIFSAFVAVLNVVEYFMHKIHNRDENCVKYGLDRFAGSWILGQDYYRLDGKTQKNARHHMITKFNDPSNQRTKCFLISAKAGGQGINLIGANRVIILDTSWNPSNDQQNIFRIFRLGQKRPCFVYRLLSMGTMEEKVYSRSVTKQAMSFRVVDEQQIDRHYNMAELAELYTLTKTDYTQRPVPIRPADNILSSLLHNFPELVYKYHEHDSLLENKPEQDLSEADKAEAWAAYEKDVNMQRTGILDSLGSFDPNLNNPHSGYRFGNTGGMVYPYGYTKPFGSFDLLSNSQSYGANLGNSLLTNYLSSYQSGLQSLSTDPNLIRLRQMYQNQSSGAYPSAYNLSTSPTGQTTPFNFYGGGLINQQGYYKSITPPAPSQIRPMTGGFTSLSDMANYLSIPSSDPASPITSNTAISTTTSTVSLPSSSYLSKELESNIWKNYFNNASQLGFLPGTRPQTPISLTNSPTPLSTTITSTTNISPLQNTVTSSSSSSSGSSNNAINNNVSINSNSSGNNSNNNILTFDLTKASNPPVAHQSVKTPISSVLLYSSPAQSINTKPQQQPQQQQQQQPSIPTSVITKPHTSKINSTNTPLIISEVKSLTSTERYSPKPHVIVKNSKSGAIAVATTAISVIPSSSITTTTESQPPVVKNFNMGIVYPGQKEGLNNALKITQNSTSGQLGKTKELTSTTTTTINNSITVAQTVDNKKVSITKANIPAGNINQKTPITPQSLLKPQIKQITVLNKKPVNSLSNLQVGGININELAKTGALSITPIPSTNSGRSDLTTSIKQANKQILKSFTPASGITVKSIPTTKTLNSTQIIPTKVLTTKINSNVLATGNINLKRSNSSVAITPNSNTSTIAQTTVHKNKLPTTLSSSGVGRYSMPNLNMSSSSNKIITITGSSVGKTTVPPLAFPKNNNAKTLTSSPALTKRQISVMPVNPPSGSKQVTTINQMNPIRITNNYLKRKSNALTDLSSNKALTVTELKKQKLQKGATNVQWNQNQQNPRKDNVVDIVELD